MMVALGDEDQGPTEDLDSFRLRARRWLAETMPKIPGAAWDPVRDDDDRANGARELQRRVWDGGFAGICYPRRYGGLGLPVEYQRAFDKEAADYQLPAMFSNPTMSIIGPTILDCASEEQKLRYIPAFLRGDELWVQFMSEPSGGSDMAGARTRATRDGDVLILNGSKIWSTNAYRADFALAIVRTNWDVPKHRGLSILIVPIHHPGISVTQIMMADGNVDFCQEFFDDAIIPVENIVGEIDDGWTVATRLLFHERAAVSGSSPYLSVAGTQGGSRPEPLIDVATRVGRTDDPSVVNLLGEGEVLATVRQQLIRRVSAGLTTEYFSSAAGAMLRLFGGVAASRRATIVLEIVGEGAVASLPGAREIRAGTDFLQRQTRSIGGGTTEISRNIISERVLGMPRELVADKDIPFNQVGRKDKTT
jgi:alkylation response protein AidB-like acyl-CoA dehydrogenase